MIASDRHEPSVHRSSQTNCGALHWPELNMHTATADEYPQVYPSCHMHLHMVKLALIRVFVTLIPNLSNLSHIAIAIRIGLKCCI